VRPVVVRAAEASFQSASAVESPPQAADFHHHSLQPIHHEELGSMTLENSALETVETTSVPATTNGSAHTTLPTAAPGGPPTVKEDHLPKAQTKGSRSRLWIGAVAAAVAAVVFVVWFVWFRDAQGRGDLVTAKVGFRGLQLKVVERGTLEAKENRDIKCEVKTGSRGAPKIKWVVENGTFVNKGDLLVDIDDSYLQEQALSKKIERDKAETDKIAAEQTYPVKKNAIGLAKQNLDKWIKGDYPQQLHDLEGQIQIAESNVLQQEDRTAWVGRMVKKQYMTASQQEAELATLKGNRLSLQKLQEQKKVLQEYTDPVNRQTYENAIKQANVDERTAFANLESAKAVFLQQDASYKDLLDQIKQCKVYTPYSGIVVYAVPEQTMRGSGATQSIIAQGEPVQYGQKILSIPDLSHMLVNVRIHEAFINQMRAGLPVSVRVDAVPGRALTAKVKSVANVASPPDWMSPDVKVYQAYVEITESVESLKLKPGLSAVCTIYTDTKAEKALAVPVESIVSAQERGGKPRAYVLASHSAEMRELDLGITDEKYVEVKSGLNEGESIVLNPRALLGAKEKRSFSDDEKVVPTGGKGAPGKQYDPSQPGGKGKGKGKRGPGGPPGGGVGEQA
jgi:multidrug efflux pump subunit AcrA (membrane-fusion protein)